MFQTGTKTMLVWPECKSFWERPAPPDATYFLSESRLDVRRIDEPDLATLSASAKRIAWIGEDAARAAKLGIDADAVNPAKLVAALDRETRRVVALKMLKQGAASEPVIVYRFVEEARITAQLEHPNIVPGYDLGAMPNGEP